MDHERSENTNAQGLYLDHPDFTLASPASYAVLAREWRKAAIPVSSG